MTSQISSLQDLCLEVIATQVHTKKMKIEDICLSMELLEKVNIFIRSFDTSIIFTNSSSSIHANPSIERLYKISSLNLHITTWKSVSNFISEKFKEDKKISYFYFAVPYYGISSESKQTLFRSGVRDTTHTIYYQQ